MKRTVVAGVMGVAGLLVGSALLLPPVQAQQAAGGIRIFVIDVNKVFKDYTKYQSMTEGLKADIEAKEKELRATENIMRSKVEEMKALKSKADQERVEKELADLKFGFEKSRRNYQEELVRKEADIYSTVYKEMSDLLEAYCGENGIHMVLRLRADTEGEGGDNPQAVMQTLSKQVVYHHPNLDLTEVIASGLNARMKAGGAKR